MKNPLVEILVKMKIIGNAGSTRGVIANFFWLVTDKFLRYGLSILVSVWMARYLGPKDFGDYSFAIALLGLCTPLLTLGLDSIVVKELVERPKHTNTILSATIGLKFIGSIVTVIFCILYAFLTQNEGSAFWAVVIISLSSIFQIFDAIDYWFQAQSLSKYAVISKNISLLIILGLRIVLLIYHYPLEYFAFAYFFEILLNAISLLIIFKIRSKSYFKWDFSVVESRTLLGLSWPIFISLVGTFAYYKIGQVMIEGISGPASLGVYSVALKFSEIWYFIPSMIYISVMPNLIETRVNDKEVFKKKITRMYSGMIWMSIGIAIVITLLSDSIINLLYGIQYALAADVLKVHIWSGVFIFSGTLAQLWFLIEGKIKYTILYNFLGAISNIIFNLILIPHYGLFGAATSAILSYGICNYLCPALFVSTRENFYLLSKAFNPKNIF